MTLRPHFSLTFHSDKHTILAGPQKPNGARLESFQRPRTARAKQARSRRARSGNSELVGVSGTLKRLGVNYYPHHIGDHSRDTAHLSLIEEGVYRRMLDLYYANELPLQSDLTALCRVLRARTEDERAAVQTVLAEFFTAFPEGYRHKRCDEELAKLLEKSAKARASINARWHGKSDTNVLRTNNGRTTDVVLPNTQYPRPKTQSKPQPRSAFAPPDWVSLSAWQAFEEMRSKSKKAMTDRARGLIVGELEKLKAQGHDPASVLEQSVRNNWQDVYPLKDKGAFQKNGQSAPAADGKITCRKCSARVSSHSNYICNPCARLGA